MEQFDHHSEHFAQHWRETYRELRESCPVAHSDLHGGFSVVTKYDDIKQVLADPRRSHAAATSCSTEKWSEASPSPPIRCRWA